MNTGEDEKNKKDIMLSMQHDAKRDAILKTIQERGISLQNICGRVYQNS